MQIITRGLGKKNMIARGVGASSSSTVVASRVLSYVPTFLNPATDYDEIRDRLGNADSTLIPNSIIARTSYLQYAESQIRRAVPNYLILKQNAENLINFRVAAICMTAYLLIPKVWSLLKSENIIDYSYTNLSPTEWSQKSQALRDEATNAIGYILYPNGWNSELIMIAMSGPSQVALDPPVSLLFPLYVLDPPSY